MFYRDAQGAGHAGAAYSDDSESTGVLESERMPTSAYDAQVSSHLWSPYGRPRTDHHGVSDGRVG